jgi:hypothetical protein
MLKSSARITYTPRPDAAPEADLDALAAVYHFLVLEKGVPHDLTNTSTPKTVKNGPRKIDKEKT